MKRILIILLCIPLLASCAGGTDDIVITTETTSSAMEITTPQLSITAVPLQTTNETPVMDSYWISEYEWRIKQQKERAYVELSGDMKFYECEYTQDIVVSGEAYADTEAYARAKEFFCGTQAYLDICGEAEEIYKELGGKEPDSFMVHTTLVQAVDFDFNSDGKEESAFLFSLAPVGELIGKDEAAFQAICCAIDYNAPRYLVLRDCNGAFSLSDINYAGNAELYRLRYRDFSHLVISGGVSNNSSCADFFSAAENGFKHELREFQAYGILDGIFLSQTMAQVSDNWLIFWCKEAGCYVTPEAEYLTPEKSLEISAEFTEQGLRPVTIIGGIYSEYGGKSYIKKNGSFQPLHKAQTGIQLPWYESYGERHTPLDREFNIPFVKNFDYERALENIIALDD